MKATTGIAVLAVLMVRAASADTNYDLGLRLGMVLRTAGAGFPTELTCTAIDDAGNMFVTGSFTEPSRFGEIILVCEGDVAKSGECRSQFLAKYDSNDNFEWVRHISCAVGSSVAAQAQASALAPPPLSGAAPRPRLEIYKSNQTVFFVWPAEYSDLILEASDLLSPFPIWMPVTAPRVQQENALIIQTPAEGAAKFYRLRSP